MSYYLHRVFYRVVLKAPSFQCRSSPPGGVFSNEEARLLTRSRGNDHVVNGSVENLILNFGQTKFVVCHGNCRNGEQTKFFRFVCSPLRQFPFILLGDVKFIALQRF